jgi:anti-anti-sigma regulatory factor
MRTRFEPRLAHPAPDKSAAAGCHQATSQSGMTDTGRIVQAMKSRPRKKRTIRICAGECLDANSYSLFYEAVFRCGHRLIEKLEIDLCKTRIIKRSGLAMLLLLIKESGLASDAIALLNCQPEIRSQLASCHFSRRFSFQ